MKIKEHEVPNFIKKYTDIGYEELQKKNMKDAILNLKKAETIITVLIFLNKFLILI